MLDQKNRNPELFPDHIDAAEQISGFRRIHTCCRLVQKKQLHPGCQCPRDLQLSLLSIGKIICHKICLILETEDFQKLHGLFPVFSLLTPIGAAPEKSTRHFVLNTHAIGYHNIFNYRH